MECFNSFLNNFALHENKISMPKFGKFLWEYYNMENKILDFQFEPVCAKQTHPNYTVGSDQDEAETKYD